MTLNQEKSFHYFILGLMTGLLFVSMGFAYMSANGYLQEQPKVDEDLLYEQGGQSKPLPDFIVDKVPTDELETLKP